MSGKKENNSSSSINKPTSREICPKVERDLAPEGGADGLVGSHWLTSHNDRGSVDPHPQWKSASANRELKRFDYCDISIYHCFRDGGADLTWHH